MVLVPPAAEADGDLEAGADLGEPALGADSAPVGPDGDAADADPPEADAPDADGAGPQAFSEP